MIEIMIPGTAGLKIRHLVLDFNGTIAFNGEIIPCVFEKLKELSQLIDIHLITADTYSTVEKQIGEIPCKLTILSKNDQQAQKEDYVLKLNPDATAAIGNGKNDMRMLHRAVLGIAVIQGEGAFSGTIISADMVCTSICDALDLLLNPLRITAGLRQ
jgi:soluble P-type ATPase